MHKTIEHCLKKTFKKTMGEQRDIYDDILAPMSKSCVEAENTALTDFSA